MNLLFHHKSQAFYLTSFLFALLLLGLLYSSQWFKVVPQNQEVFSLAMQQFISSTQQRTTQSSEEILKEIPQEIPPLPPLPPQKPKKHKKTQKPILQQPIPQQPAPHHTSHITQHTQPPSVPIQNTLSAQSVETFSFGKDDHPFLKAIKKAIDSNVSYPRQARKMRMEGEVLVEFLWTKHKTLKDLKVRKSSGYPLLDKNALQAIQRASLDFPEYHNDARLQIPIVFVLNF